MVNHSTFFLLPPVRWAADTRILDSNTINFKPPEALEDPTSSQLNSQAMHSKFVWKFSIIMYLLMTKSYPFTFTEANGSSTSIDAASAKKFAELIRYRIQRGLNWNSSLAPINSIVTKAMICDPNQRISFQQLHAEFSQVYGYYKPHHEVQQVVNLMAQGAMNLKTQESASRQVIKIDR